MRKKYLGGLLLLAFISAVATPSLIVVKPADATDNVVYDRSHTVYYVCPSGGIGHSETNECVISAEWYHPPPETVITYETEEATGFTYEVHTDVHRDHNVTYNNLTTSESRYVDRYFWSCR